MTSGEGPFSPRKHGRLRGSTGTSKGEWMPHYPRAREYSQDSMSTASWPRQQIVERSWVLSNNQDFAAPATDDLRLIAESDSEIVRLAS